MEFGNSRTGKYNWDVETMDAMRDKINAGDVRGAVAIAANHLDIPTNVAEALVATESSFDTNAVNKESGATGALQLMPDTAKSLGVNINDPVQNIIGGLTYYKAGVDHLGDYSLAYGYYQSGLLDPKKIASVISNDPYAKAGMEHFANNLRSLGVSSTTVSKTPQTSQTSQTSQTNQASSPLINQYLENQKQITQLFSDINNIYKDNLPKLNSALNNITKSYEDYANALKNNKAPTYEETSKPKNALQEFFKVLLPTVLTLAAVISPGKFGYRAALASSLWNSIQKGDIQAYQIKLNDWKNQTESLKEEAQAKLAALQSRAQIVKNDMSMDLQMKQYQLQMLGAQQTSLLKTLDNLEKTNLEVAKLNETSSYHRTLEAIREQSNQIAANRVSEGRATLGKTGSTTLGKTGIKSDRGTTKVIFGKGKDKNEITISTDLANIINTAVGNVSNAFFAIVSNKKDYPNADELKKQWYDPNNPNDTSNTSYIRNVLVKKLQQGASEIGAPLTDELAANIAYQVFSDYTTGLINSSGITEDFQRAFLSHVLLPAYNQGLLNSLPDVDQKALSQMNAVLPQIMNSDYFGIFNSMQVEHPSQTQTTETITGGSPQTTETTPSQNGGTY
jgi:hypothetical protein